MSQTSIMWQPIVSQGEPLPVSTPDLFVLQMQRAFSREWPMRLTAKDRPILLGMAATTAIQGNPFVDLLEQLDKFGKIEVWPVHGEDVGI